MAESSGAANAHTGAAADPRPDRLAQFAALFREHMPFVFRTARRLGVSDAALDDVVQDVFLVVHRRWGELAWSSSARTLLFGITLRVAKDHRRALARRRTHIPEATGEALVESVPSLVRPDEELERDQARRILHQILDTLDYDQRALLIAVELEQLSVPEVAQAMQLKLNTAYGKLRAARQEFGKAALRFRERAAREGASR